MINQRPSIEEEDKEMIHKAQQRELNLHKHEHSPCSSSDTRRVKYLLISHERGQDGTMMTA